LDRTYSITSILVNQTTFSYTWPNEEAPALAVYRIIETGNDGSQSVVWYDKIGRNIRTETLGFDGIMTRNDTEYNENGQLYRISEPYYGVFDTWAETYQYYDNGRVQDIVRHTGQNTHYDYSAGIISETTDGKTSSKTFGADGLTISTTDIGGSISYEYYSDGKLKQVTAPGNLITKLYYDDAARNKTKLEDPSVGTINYTYNSLGQILTTTKNSNPVLLNNHYPDGRITTIITPEGTTTYGYNSNKQLYSISSPGNTAIYYLYDTKGRVSNISERINGLNFSGTSMSYDSYGRLSTITHPSGIIEKRKYNGYGHLRAISVGSDTLFTTIDVNARGQMTQGKLGSNLQINNVYDSLGYPSRAYTGSLQDYYYSFQPNTGNLNYRVNAKQGQIRENFVYDNLERLDSAYIGSTTLQKMLYHPDRGSITHKKDIGVFNYAFANHPYSVSSIVSSTGVIPVTLDSLSYTSFESVNSITEGAYNAQFWYNSDNERAKMVVKQNGTDILTRWYPTSSYIKETSAGTTKEYTFIGGDAYSAPVVAVKEGTTIAYYYLIRDHLGSITQVVNATNNSVAAEYSYDAWGRMRNVTNWNNYAPGSEPVLMIAGRGFTGHEHLPWFNIINMNGRLYDPLLGQFLSADNFVQAPNYSQSFNRYAYALNNPLIYTDPSGEVFGVDDALIILTMAYLGGVQANFFSAPETGGNPFNPGDWNWNSSSTYIRIGSGALTGASMAGYQIIPTLFSNIDGMITRGVYSTSTKS
jgi:RHS repeat-associated protein